MSFSTDPQDDLPTTRVLRETRLTHSARIRGAAVAHEASRTAITYPVMPQSSWPVRRKTRAPVAPASQSAWPDVLPAARKPRAYQPATTRPIAPVAHALPHAASLSEERTEPRWPMWLTLFTSSIALVMMGYLGALVQMDSLQKGPRLIPLPATSRPAAQEPHTTAANGPNDTGGALANATHESSGRSAATRGRGRLPAVTRTSSGTDSRSSVEPPLEAHGASTPPVMIIRRLSGEESQRAVTTGAGRPERVDVQRSLEGMRDVIVACAGGLHGTVKAQVTILPSGRVSYSLIEGAFAGTAVGSCMARALRSTVFPTFTGPSFKVSYPFRV